MPALFRSIAQGKETMDEVKAIQFLNALQASLAIQPPASDSDVKIVFRQVQNNGTLTLDSFTPIFESWAMRSSKSLDRREAVPEATVLEPSPLSAFYSHPINKTYDIKIPVQGVRYVKISFTNPDDKPKSLTLRSEDETMLYVRKPTLSLQPRVGQDFLRLKFMGRKQPMTIDTRLALIHTDSNDVEEVLLFHVITEGSAPLPGDVLEPMRLQTPVNPGTAAG